MASKRYTGKQCVYCGLRSDSVDHVLARQFFLPEHRAHLPAVPACTRCNELKSTLEHYAVTVLPMAGQNAASLEAVRTKGLRRLQKNQALQRQIFESAERIWWRRRGSATHSIAFTLDWGRIEALFALITRGLMAFHFDTILSGEDSVLVRPLDHQSELEWESDLFLANEVHTHTDDWGEGTFAYRRMQAADQPHASAWVFSMYGGVVLLGQTPSGPGAATSIGVLTSPPGSKSDGA